MVRSVVTRGNAQRLPGEDVFLRGLYEIRSDDNQYDAAINVFGRDESVQSRAYSWCVKHIYENFKDLGIDNLRWWRDNGFMEESRTKILEKMTKVQICSIFQLLIICRYPLSFPITTTTYLELLLLLTTTAWRWQLQELDHLLQDLMLQGMETRYSDPCITAGNPSTV